MISPELSRRRTRPSNTTAPPSFFEKSEPAAEAPIPHGERSNLQLYLQEIGKTPLLTIEEEDPAREAYPPRRQGRP
jgi:hypothetical protein